MRNRVLGVAVAVGLVGALAFGARAQTAPDPVLGRFVCFGYDQQGDPLGNTAANDGILFSVASRNMHFLQSARMWHGEIFVRLSAATAPTWYWAVYPAEKCALYPDVPAGQADPHAWLDTAH